ncbi:MAG: FMN-binding protein [Streptosporangiaceae bacterium]
MGNYGPGRPRRASADPGASAGPGAPAARRSAVGATEQYGYGYLAVRVIVRGNRIVNVTVPVIQTAEQYSQQLAMQVIPTLRSEVLAGQTAGISAVSGATYTSQAYATSLQAALDKLHVR